jgi:hypothetical protein
MNHLKRLFFDEVSYRYGKGRRDLTIKKKKYHEQYTRDK